MTLADLADDPRFKNVNVPGLCFDSRKMQTGEIFFAIRGTAVDGHKYLEEVCRKRPVAIVVENKEMVPKSYTGHLFITKNSRALLDLWAAKFFGRPGDSLLCIGVTGTNGKTTTVYMLEKILTGAGWPTGVMGTIDHHMGKKVWETELTTPDPLTMQFRLKEFVRMGAKAAAFEMSSIAIDQNRASSIPFDAAIFTNFSRDHLDYHGNMDKYFQAKLKLFTEVLLRSTKKKRFAVLNADNAMIASMPKKSGAYCIWFGQGKGDYPFKVLEQSMAGSTFEVKGKEYSIATPGVHNVYNAVGAIVTAIESNVSWESVQKSLHTFTGAPGRLESVPNNKGLHIFVDYAHTDDALRSVLESLRGLMKSSNSNGRIWTVFGCGGDRDKGKRPLMAKAAMENSSHVILTSDNPRNEDPNAIIQDCIAGIPYDRPHIEVDRKKAIAFALQTAKEGDVILIAGKGHENYQILGDTKIPFSDVEVVRESLT
jgi:UDP-N-acetylmuramoyl-L-alanyl-D-glutamate--2,6-diaminopimelate ligase